MLNKRQIEQLARNSSIKGIRYYMQREENQKLKECHFKYEEMTGIDLLLGE